MVRLFYGAAFQKRESVFNLTRMRFFETPVEVLPRSYNLRILSNM